MPWGFFSNPKSQSRAPQAAREQWPPEMRAAIADLDRLIAARIELEPAGRALGRILEAAFGNAPVSLIAAASGNGTDPESLIESIRASWQEDRPALVGLSFSFDQTALIDRAAAICAAIRPDDSPPTDRLRLLINNEPQRFLDWVSRALEPAADSVKLAGVDCGPDFDPAQVNSVVRLITLPGLAEWSQRVCRHLTDGIWPHGICPICGSGPALAESRGLEQRRHLRCDSCAADWPCQHFLCPFCGTSDHRALRHVSVDGKQDRARLVICDHCGGRLKVIATIAPLSPPGLLVAELEMVDLDLIGDAR